MPNHPAQYWSALAISLCSHRVQFNQMGTEGGSIAGLIIVIIPTSDLPSDEIRAEADDYSVDMWSLTCELFQDLFSLLWVGMCCFVDYFLLTDSQI